MYEAGTPAQVDQGVIVKTALFEPWYPVSAGVILTPRCDIEHKADFLTVCAVVDPASLAAAQKWNDTQPINSHIGSILSGEEFRWHWLEPFPGFDHGAIVDFQLLTSVAVSTLDTATLVKLIADPWRAHLAQRYSSYASRVGVPETTHAERAEKRGAITKSILEQRAAVPLPVQEP